MRIDKFNSEHQPEIQPVNAAAIPIDLRGKHHWVCWRWQWKDNKAHPEKSKWTKPPCNTNGEICTHTNSNLKFKAALKAHRQSGCQLGIGISLRPEDNLCGVDLDGVIKKTGKLKPAIKKALKKAGLLGSHIYTEISPSGTGIRIFGTGKVKNRGARKGSCIEIYSSNRYLTVTGNANSSAGANLLKLNKQFESLWSKLSKPKTDNTQATWARSAPNSNVSDPESNRAYQSILRMLPALTGLGYEEWMEIGMAIHYEASGSIWAFKAWVNWAEGFSSFDSQADCAERWASFTSTPDNPITVGTVRYRYNQLTLDTLKDSMDFSHEDDAVTAFNGRFVMAAIEGKTTIIEIKTISNGIKKPVFMNVHDFKIFYSNRMIIQASKKGDQYLPAAEAWITSPNRNGADAVIFDPAKPPGYDDKQELFNLWMGLSTDNPAKQPGTTPIDQWHPSGAWLPMYQHIRDNICSGQAEWAEYLFMWMANMIQHPGGERPGVCISFYGKKGTGKSILGKWFGRLFGTHYAHATCREDLIGKNNGHLVNSVFVFADEAYFPGDKQAEGRLKALITEDKFLVEEKFVPRFQITSHLNIMMASNEEWSFPATIDERRFFALQVGEKHMQDIDYFKAITTAMESGGLEAMHTDLCSIEVDMGFLRNPPATEQLNRAIAHSENSVYAFWRHVSHTGGFTDYTGKLVDSGKVLKPTIWQSYYIVFCDVMKLGSFTRFNAVHFGRESNKCLQGKYRKCFRKASSMYVDFDKMLSLLDVVFPLDPDVE